MNHRVIGTTLPVLELQLQAGESVVAVSGELSWMSSSVTMHTSTQHGGGGGFLGALKRVAGGGSLFMTEYTAQGQPDILAFATRARNSKPFVWGRRDFSGRSHWTWAHLVAIAAAVESGTCA